MSYFSTGGLQLVDTKEGQWDSSSHLICTVLQSFSFHQPDGVEEFNMRRRGGLWALFHTRGGLKVSHVAQRPEEEKPPAVTFVELGLNTLTCSSRDAECRGFNKQVELWKGGSQRAVSPLKSPPLSPAQVGNWGAERRLGGFVKMETFWVFLCERKSSVLAIKIKEKQKEKLFGFKFLFYLWRINR